MHRVSVAGLLMAVLSLPGHAAGQSLADVARAAEARRKEPGAPPSRVITNKDLPSVPASRPAPAPSPEAPAPDATTPPAAAAPVAGRPALARDEAYWKERMRPLRERLEGDRALAADTRRRADALLREAEQCLRVGVVCAEWADSQRAFEEHKALLAVVARDERLVFELEEEARRAGVPPGWLRP